MTKAATTAAVAAAEAKGADLTAAETLAIAKEAAAAAEKAALGAGAKAAGVDSTATETKTRETLAMAKGTVAAAEAAEAAGDGLTAAETLAMAKRAAAEAAAAEAAGVDNTATETEDGASGAQDAPSASNEGEELMEELRRQVRTVDWDNEELRRQVLADVRDRFPSNYAERAPLPQETRGLSLKVRNSVLMTDTRPTFWSHKVHGSVI